MENSMSEWEFLVKVSGRAKSACSEPSDLGRYKTRFSGRVRVSLSGKEAISAFNAN